MNNLRQNPFWFHRNPFAAVTLFIIVAAITIFLLGEIYLRICGYQPGMLGKEEHFDKVSRVKLLKGYVADSNGIMRISNEARTFINEQLRPGNQISILEKILFHTSEFSSNITSLINEFDLLNKNQVNNDFQQFIVSLKQKAPAELTEDERAYLQYCHSPVNTDGFRSIEFRKYDTPKKSILLLGDSFTWGSDPEHITNSFADLLAIHGYVVYNTGITATDPAQYLAVAKVYIPLLKPDIVVVNFFIGNDIMNIKREAKPFQLVYYPTNAGNIMAFPDGFYLDSPEFAYDYVLRQSSIPNQDHNRFNKLLAFTAITTKIWVLLRQMNIIDFQVDQKYAALMEQADKMASPFPVSEEYMKEIQTISEMNSARFVLAAIPEVKELHLPIPEGYPGLFRELKLYVPKHIREADYAPDEHFNKSGNMKYANFILSLIESKNSSVTP